MSTNMNARARGLAYAATLKGQSRSKSATTSSFGRKVSRPSDSAPSKQRTPPSYGFVDQQKGPVDESADKSAPLRDQLQEDAGDKKEDEVDKKDFSKPVPTTSRAPPKVTTSSEVVDSGPSDAFAKAWSNFYEVSLTPVVKTRSSYFFPTFIGCMNILVAMENLVNGNEYLKYICPQYLALPVRIYYSVLFFIQILKAKEAAGKLTKSEGSWFRAFKRQFPLESLPIAGPLIPAFSNIVSVRPNDAMYDWVIPNYSSSGLQVGSGANAAGTAQIEGIYYLQPMLQPLWDILRDFTTLTSAQLSNTVAVANRKWEDSGSYVKFRFGQVGTLAGVDFAAAPVANATEMLHHPALQFGLPEDINQMRSALQFWKNSNAVDIPAPNNNNQTYDNIGAMMMMTEDFSIFEPCLEMAAIQCRFFEHSSNMSDIPSTGGNEALCSAMVTGNAAAHAAPVSWYPRQWRNMNATFVTSRADTTQAQFMNSAYSLTTATISWVDGAGHHIGGRQNGLRTGPYWLDINWQFEITNAIPVGHRTRAMIQSEFFNYEGKASL